MVKYSFLSLLLILLFNFSYQYDYANSATCVTVSPNDKEDCLKVHSDIYRGKETACCYVTYKLDTKYKKCVPIMKTYNGLNMYQSQLKSMDASSVDINCYSSYLSLSILIILILVL